MSKKVIRSTKSAQRVAKDREDSRKQRQAQQNRIIAIVGGVLAVALVIFVVWQLVGSTQPEVPAEGVIAEGTILDGERPLAALPPEARNDYYSEYPEMVIDPAKQYEAVIVTENGDMRLRLFAEAAPLTVNNFVYLARQGFYDNTTFHRVLADFMAQAGDPTGTGSGGPGYRFADETDNGLIFDRPGLLAMANAGPATNGSQFFVTLAPTAWLDGLHTIFGELIAGEDVLNSIALREPGSPTPGDLIERIDIYEID